MYSTKGSQTLDIFAQGSGGFIIPEVFERYKDMAHRDVVYWWNCQWWGNIWTQ